MKAHITAAALALGSTAYAQVSRRCQDTVCFSLNVPEDTGSSGHIFIQISAPTSVQWVGLGQGSSMSGANMFIMYTDSSASNVTVSPRSGTGHVEPQQNGDARISLLGGTGVSNGQMVANIRCESCTSWNGGRQDFTSSAGSWIWAMKSGSSIDSDDAGASLSQHDNNGNLEFDFSAAKGGNSANPLSSSGQSCTRRSSSGSASATATAGGSSPSNTNDESYWASKASSFGSRFGDGPAPTGRPFSDNYRRAVAADDDCDDSSNEASSQEGFSQGSTLTASRRTQMLMAHGILACLAFAVFFPIGGIIIRVLSLPGLVWIHAAMQVVAYLMFIVAFGLGIYVANDQNLLDEYHPVIGIVLFVLVFLQPIFGMLHHRLYKKHQARTFWSHVHIWLGRIVITLGIINGGLGFMLADNTNWGPIVYGVVAGIIWLAYAIAVVYGELRRKKQPQDHPPKYTPSPPGAASHASSSQPTNATQRRDVSPAEYYGQNR